MNIQRREEEKTLFFKIDCTFITMLENAFGDFNINNKKIIK